MVCSHPCVDSIDVEHIKVALATAYPILVVVGSNYLVRAPAGDYVVVAVVTLHVVVAGVAVDPVVPEAAVSDETKPKEASFTP